MKKNSEVQNWRQGDKTAGYYEESIKRTKERPQRHAGLMKVVKPEDMPWEESRQGKLKHMVNDEMGAVSQTMTAYLQEISPGSKTGKHRHMAEEARRHGRRRRTPC